MAKRITKAKTAKAKATKALKQIVAEHRNTRAERAREVSTKPAIDSRTLLPELKWGTT